MSPPGQDYVIVSGICTETAVESIHVVAQSSTADKARALLSSLKEKSSSTTTGSEELDEDVKSVCNEDELAEEEAPANTILGIAGTRKELRASRKQEIENHLAIKPSIHPLGEIDAVSTANLYHESEASELSLASLAKQVVSIENDLLSIQSNFNNQLLDAAIAKIAIRDDIKQHNMRLEEIHHILLKEGDAPSIDTQITFLHDEYTARDSDQTTIDGARKICTKNTVHDPAFILHEDVDLSKNAEALKSQAKNSLQNEIKHLIERAHAQIKDFNENLSRLKQMKMQVELKHNLKFRHLLLVVKERQMMVMIEYESKVEQLKTSGLEHDDLESQMKTALETRNRELETLEVLIPINIFDFQLNEACDKPMLISKSMLHEYQRRTVELEKELKSRKFHISGARRQHKHLDRTVSKLKTELKQGRDKCTELQCQKFGKPVDSTILDVSSVGKVDHSKEVDQLQDELECLHRQDIEKAKNEQYKLKRELLDATNKNTKLLREIASIRQQQLQIDNDLKSATSSNTRNKSTKRTDDNKEYEKYRVLSTEQKIQIDLLRQEIQSLKSKCGHIPLSHR